MSRHTGRLPDGSEFHVDVDDGVAMPEPSSTPEPEFRDDPRFKALTQAGRFMVAGLIQTAGWPRDAALNAVEDIETEAREVIG